MKKLLHERLREHADLGCMSFIGNGYDLALWPEEARALADEIERYYIPRPRFEDGEPVQWSETNIVWDDGKSYMFNAVTARGRLLAYAGDEVYAEAELNDDGFVKRPSPEVLDADGVEIKVGDTVWSKGEAEYIVEEIKDEDHIHLRRPYEDKALVKMTARCLTHKEPDSMEKLRDDMHREWLIGFEIGKEKARDWSDRLSALIEKVD